MSLFFGDILPKDSDKGFYFLSCSLNLFFIKPLSRCAAAQAASNQCATRFVLLDLSETVLTCTSIEPTLCPTHFLLYCCIVGTSSQTLPPFVKGGRKLLFFFNERVYKHERAPCAQTRCFSKPKRETVSRFNLVNRWDFVPNPTKGAAFGIRKLLCTKV